MHWLLSWNHELNSSRSLTDDCLFLCSGSTPQRVGRSLRIWTMGASQLQIRLWMRKFCPTAVAQLWHAAILRGSKLLIPECWCRFRFHLASCKSLCLQLIPLCKVMHACTFSVQTWLRYTTHEFLWSGWHCLPCNPRWHVMWTFCCLDWFGNYCRVVARTSLSIR